MKTLFDTSVLVAALLAKHPHHSVALPWLLRAQAGEFKWCIAAHSLAECYSTLTASAPALRLPPALVLQTLTDGLLSPEVEIIELTTADYRATLTRAASLGLSSGMIYDALIAQAGLKAGIGRLVTFNLRHFLRVWPEDPAAIVNP